LVMMNCTRSSPAHLDRGAQPARVDEGEHVVQPAVGRADEPAGGALELELAGGRAVAAHLDDTNVGVASVRTRPR